MNSKRGILKRLVEWFDKLEDGIRGHLSHYPITYSILGGVAVVLFWRSVWEVADIIFYAGYSFSWIFNPFIQIFLSTITLSLTGLMVSTFIGDRIILSGLKHTKKVSEVTEERVREEAEILLDLEKKVAEIEKKVDNLLTK